MSEGGSRKTGRDEESERKKKRQKGDQREAAGATLWLSISESLSLQSHRGDSSVLVPWKKKLPIDTFIEFEANHLTVPG